MIRCDDDGLVSVNGTSNDIITEFGAICEVILEEFNVEVCLNMFTRAMNVVKEERDKKEERDNNGTQQSTN